jgi:hypothetical protein
VFLSYSRQDAGMMARLRDDLRAQGLAVWTDEALTPGTPSWLEGIEREIERTRCLLVVLSPDAKVSAWVERETAYAREMGVPVVPVLARGEVRDAVPIELINVQRVDARGDYPTSFRAVLDALATHLGGKALAGATDAARLTLREVGMLALYAGQANAVSFSPDGNLLAVGTASDDVQVWDVGARRRVADLSGHRDYVRTVAFAPDGMLATGSGDGTMRVWDVVKRREVQRYRKPGLRLWKRSRDTFNSVAWSPSSHMIVATSQEPVAWLFFCQTMEPFHALDMSEIRQPLLTASFHPVEEWVAVAGWGGFVGVFDQRTGARVASVGQRVMTRELAFSPDGRLLAVGGGEAAIHLFEVPSWDQVGLLRGHHGARTIRGPVAPLSVGVSVQSLAFSPDGRWLASVADDGRLIVWDVHRGRAAATLPWATPGATGCGSRGVAWRPDGEILAVASGSSSVRLLAVA